MPTHARYPCAHSTAATPDRPLPNTPHHAPHTAHSAGLIAQRPVCTCPSPGAPVVAAQPSAAVSPAGSSSGDMRTAGRAARLAARFAPLAPPVTTRGRADTSIRVAMGAELVELAVSSGAQAPGVLSSTERWRCPSYVELFGSGFRQTDFLSLFHPYYRVWTGSGWVSLHRGVRKPFDMRLRA